MLDITSIPSFLVAPPHSDEEASGLAYLRSQSIPAHPFYALKGSNSGLRTKYMADTQGFVMGPKTLTIGITHFHIWSAAKWAVESGQSKSDVFGVFESDVEFTSSTWREELSDISKDLPDDWDMLYIGHCCTQPIEDNPRISERLRKLIRGMGMHAYLFRYKAAEKLLDSNQKMWTSIDIQLVWDSFPRMNVFGVFPRLATQRGAFSD